MGNAMPDPHSDLSPDPSGNMPWSMDAIPYRDLDGAAVRDDALLFAILASASFIEITSDVYTANLVAFFDSDPTVVDWLAHHWEPEELQHGAALKRYVQTAWPEFDWEGAYRGFLGEYMRCCTIDQLNPTRALEMVARCVVETGTASFYRMLSDAAPEPVLRELAARISSDEVRHYKNFYRFFLRYREREHPGRAAVLKTLYSRVMEVDNEDAHIAFKHVFRARDPGADFEERAYRDFREGVRRIAQRHFPHEMAMKMFLKPLRLAPAIGRVVLPPVTSATRLLLLRQGHRPA
jgi:rubrerythrin